MKKEDFIKLGISEEQAEKVAQAFAEYLKGFIPKSRFDEVNEAKKKLEGDIKTRDEQLETLKKIDAKGLQAEIEKLQGENKKVKATYESELKQMRINNAVEKALMSAKAKNIKAVKALLDLEKAALDGETVLGLGDQIKKLTESEDTKFLFGVKEAKDEGKGFRGLKPGEAKDKGSEIEPTSLADAVKMHFTKKE